MRSADPTSWIHIHRKAMSFIGLLIAASGISMVLNPTHAPGIVWIGIPVLVGGFALFAWVARPPAVVGGPALRSLGMRFLHRISWEGRLTPLFPVAGVAIIAADLAYNFVLSASPALLTEDILVLLTAGSLIGYSFVPSRYARERDFVLLFFLILDAILVAPLVAWRVVAGNPDASVDAYSWTALAPELSGILSFMGIVNSVHAVAGYTAPGLTFTPVQMSTPVTLVITTACSGIYSFGIFASALTAFLFTEYERPSLRLWLLLATGFLTSYLANLLRMVVIVLVGYYTDSAQTDLQNLLLAHSYAGWIIFLGWLAPFWALLFKFLPAEKELASGGPATAVAAPRRPKSPSCGICGKALSPSFPAARCICGAIFHRDCMAFARRCPSCHRGLVSAHDSAT